MAKETLMEGAKVKVPFLKELKEIDETAKYVYYLSNKNLETNMQFNVKGRPIMTPEYPPSVTVPNTSSVIYEGRLRLVRFYVGCDTIFVDEQPKEPLIIESFLRNGANEIKFRNGRYETNGYDKMRVLYLNVASFNEDSPYRAGHVKSIFKSYNETREAQKKTEKVNSQVKAIEMAQKANEKQIYFHARYLGIATYNHDAAAEREMENIRTDYMAAAIENPETFLKSYGDTTLKVKYWVEQALTAGTINTGKVPNTAIWSATESAICDIPGNTNQALVIDAITQFATRNTDEAEAFVNQLKAIYN